MAKVDKSAYRMEIEGNCWNAGVMEDGTLAGYWNGGPCNNATGVGGGARLIVFGAKRISPADKAPLARPKQQR